MRKFDVHETNLLREEVKNGLNIDEAIRRLYQYEYSIVESMKFLVSEYKIGLGDAKNQVSSHPIWQEAVSASKPLHDKLIEVLLKESLRNNHISMDSELIQEICKNIGSSNTIRELSETDARDLIDRIATHYIVDRNRVWWWESLAEKPVIIDYGDYGEDPGWDYCMELIQSPKHPVYLVVTDDYPEPWPVFKGSISAVASLLANLWLFEYIIVDENLSWVIFDTHHNCLVVTGTLIDRARSVIASTKGNSGSLKKG